MSRQRHHHVPVHLMYPAPGKGSRFQRHSLGIAAVGILLLWIVLYLRADPSTHWGSFFGNAIADWSGVVMTVLATKWLFEQGSAESRQDPAPPPNPVRRFAKDHSLTIFLIITGAAFAVAFRTMDPNAKWGQVVGNVVSEWTQQLGMVLLTKKLMEVGSKESAKEE
jgi:hypothetical protein